jgi:hypothetical protein
MPTLADYRKLLAAAYEGAAKVAEEHGKRLGEPAVGAAIAKEIRKLKAAE